MASTSDSRSNGISGRIKSAATLLHSEDQSLLVDIRKAMVLMKEIGVDLERNNQSEMVGELEKAVVQLLDAHENHANYLAALESVGNKYQPGEELTDFRKLLDDEMAEIQANSSTVSDNNSVIRQFREAIWKVHHAGQAMPGEEMEDIIMTSSESSLLNITCPLSGKPVIELANPVRSVECKHVYEKSAIMQYINSRQNGQARCPVAGCPKFLRVKKVVCDPLLLVEIEEMRTMTERAGQTNAIEDFTEFEDESVKQLLLLIQAASSPMSRRSLFLSIATTFVFSSSFNGSSSSTSSSTLAAVAGAGTPRTDQLALPFSPDPTYISSKAEHSEGEYSLSRLLPSAFSSPFNSIPSKTFLLRPLFSSLTTNSSSKRVN